MFWHLLRRSLQVSLHFYSCTNSSPKRLSTESEPAIHCTISTAYLNLISSLDDPRVLTFFKILTKKNINDFRFHHLLERWPNSLGTYMASWSPHIWIWRVNLPRQWFYISTTNIRALFVCSPFEWMLFKMVLLETSIAWVFISKYFSHVPNKNLMISLSYTFNNYSHTVYIYSHSLNGIHAPFFPSYIVLNIFYSTFFMFTVNLAKCSDQFQWHSLGAIVSWNLCC